LTAHTTTAGSEFASAVSRDAHTVREGETVRLRIEGIGDRGDGHARVGPGYVVVVPGSVVGQQPLVRVTTVRENVAFAEVVES
jgi:predicted RNA-binding protein with TRAM domain